MKGNQFNKKQREKESGKEFFFFLILRLFPAFSEHKKTATDRSNSFLVNRKTTTVESRQCFCVCASSNESTESNRKTKIRTHIISQHVFSARVFFYCKTLTDQNVEFRAGVSDWCFTFCCAFWDACSVAVVDCRRLPFACAIDDVDVFNDVRSFDVCLRVRCLRNKMPRRNFHFSIFTIRHKKRNRKSLFCLFRIKEYSTQRSRHQQKLKLMRHRSTFWQ